MQRHTSLARRLVWLTVAVVVLLVAGGVAMTLVSSAARDANDRRTALTRAILHASQLQVAVLDEETALRGFLVSGNAVFLEPWQDAMTRWPELFDAVAADVVLADDPSLARRDTAEVRTLHERWLRDVARPEIAAAATDLDAAQSLEAAGVGRGLVERIRGRLDALEARALASREAAWDYENGQRRLVVVTASVFALALALLVGLVVLATRRLVLAPLRALGAAAREVADGRRTHAVSVTGPEEIAAVADDVEAMRGELLSRILMQARLLEGLGQQGPAVANLRAMLSPPIPADLPELVISGQCLAGEGVLTGDWYDVLALGGGRVAITLGDVAGHGTGPAVAALAVKHVLAGALLAGTQPDVALASAVSVFDRPPAPGMDLPLLASVFVAVIDPLAGTLSYANAGHPAALLWLPGRIPPMELRATGPVLCQLTAQSHWPLGAAAFPPHAALVVYTDGLVEARRTGTSDEYGEERLEGTLTRLLRGRKGSSLGGHAPDDRLITAVFTDVLDHAGVIEDDATLLLARHTPTPVDPLPSDPLRTLRA